MDSELPSSWMVVKIGLVQGHFDDFVTTLVIKFAGEKNWSCNAIQNLSHIIHHFDEATRHVEQFKSFCRVCFF